MPESRRYLKCKVAECTSAVHAKGYCQRHYTRHWRLNKVRRKIICKVNGCDAPVHSKGYCRKHYTQVWRKGEISAVPSYGHQRSSRSAAEVIERLRVLERELRKVEEMYNQGVGFESRLRWRKEITAVRAEIDRVQDLAPATATAS